MQPLESTAPMTPPLATPASTAGHQHLTAAKSRFNVYSHEAICSGRISYSRRDFYKIALVMGQGRVNYANRGVLLNQPALMFSNPLVPYSWEPLQDGPGGYFCLFTDDFLSSDRSVSLQESPLFKLSSDPIFFLNPDQIELISDLFRKMLRELESDYVHKQDLLRTYVTLLLHEALKMQPQTAYFKHPNAASRIVAMFQELLEQQFPVDAPHHGMRLHTPGDFATVLSVHVNHLNRAVRELTGKTTSVHIAERIIAEAKDLLQHTPWSTAEIAYGLGFESPNYFNNFFKKHTGTNPSAVRAALAPAVGTPADLLLLSA